MVRAVDTLGFDIRIFNTASAVRRAIYATKRGLDASRGLNRLERLLKAATEEDPAEALTVNVTSVVFVAANQPFTTTVTRTPANGEHTSYLEQHSTFCLLTPSAGDGETITVVIRPATSVDTRVIAVSA